MIVFEIKKKQRWTCYTEGEKKEHDNNNKKTPKEKKSKTRRKTVYSVECIWRMQKPEFVTRAIVYYVVYRAYAMHVSSALTYSLALLYFAWCHRRRRHRIRCSSALFLPVSCFRYFNAFSSSLCIIHRNENARQNKTTFRFMINSVSIISISHMVSRDDSPCAYAMCSNFV